VKTGYTFTGWDLSFTNVISPLTVTAQWTAITYTIAYNKNANDAAGSTANSPHTYDTAKALTANGFTRTGYTFAGWSANADGTGASYTNSQSVINLTATANATVTLYAKWRNQNTMFYGIVTTGTVNAIKSGNETAFNAQITSGKVVESDITIAGKTLTFSGDGHWCIFVPASLGLVTIRDAGMVDVTDSFPKTDITIEGILYYMHNSSISGPQTGLKLNLSYN
jgi:uncharacterized repeat protein (TIGR02543 family)